MREFAQHHQQISHNCGKILTETENIDECERREEDSAWNAYELLLLLRTMSAAMETEARFMIPQLSENADDFNEKLFFFSGPKWEMLLEYREFLNNLNIPPGRTIQKQSNSNFEFNSPGIYYIFLLYIPSHDDNFWPNI